jgi:hypothetical protein
MMEANDCAVSAAVDQARESNDAAPVRMPLQKGTF